MGSQNEALHISGENRPSTTVPRSNTQENFPTHDVELGKITLEESHQDQGSLDTPNVGLNPSPPSLTGTSDRPRRGRPRKGAKRVRDKSAQEKGQDNTPVPLSAGTNGPQDEAINVMEAALKNLTNDFINVANEHANATRSMIYQMISYHTAVMIPAAGGRDTEDHTAAIMATMNEMKNEMKNVIITAMENNTAAIMAAIKDIKNEVKNDVITAADRGATATENMIHETMTGQTATMMVAMNDMKNQMKNDTITAMANNTAAIMAAMKDIKNEVKSDMITAADRGATATENMIHETMAGNTATMMAAMKDMKNDLITAGNRSATPNITADENISDALLLKLITKVLSWRSRTRTEDQSQGQPTD